ncbi:hypothetical protein [Parafrankia sp. FMc2]|uniref:hypothetical protein n=1 Tax=Parafrankia sp. FMc2 TaxID=3233196 RepID=UPI0034D4057B
MARTKARICSDCHGTGKIGKKLCRACNSSSAIGDVAAGAARRAANRLNGRAIKVTEIGVIETNRGRRSTRASTGVPGSAPRAACACGATEWLYHTPRGKTVCMRGHGCNT